MAPSPQCARMSLALQHARACWQWSPDEKQIVFPHDLHSGGSLSPKSSPRLSFPPKLVRRWRHKDVLRSSGPSGDVALFYAFLHEIVNILTIQALTLWACIHKILLASLHLVASFTTDPGALVTKSGRRRYRVSSHGLWWPFCRSKHPLSVLLAETRASAGFPAKPAI
jgi:hypothetical protein